MGLGDAPIVHRSAEEAGNSECLGSRVHFLQMTTERLFTLVDAADHLK